MVDRNLIDKFEEDLIKGKPVSVDKLLQEGAVIDNGTLSELRAVYFLHASMKKVGVPEDFEAQQRANVGSLIAKQLSEGYAAIEDISEYVTLGRCIATARRRARIKVHSLASKIAMAEDDYRRLETDRLDPVPKTFLERICDVLGIPIEKLDQLSTSRADGLSVSPSFARKSGKKKDTKDFQDRK